MSVKETTYFGEQGDFLTLRHLQLRGSNFEIGQHLGRLAIERYGQGPESLAADPIFVRARRTYFRQHYPIHHERMRGIAAAFGLELDDDRYDLGGLAYLSDLGPMNPGCSVVYYPPAVCADGHGYLSRYYDFALASMPGLLRIQMPEQIAKTFPPVMSEPYLMEWHPEDGGFASLALHAFDLTGGTLDGMNSEGLVVSILSDDEARQLLGPNLEPHLGPHMAVGLHELSVMRFLLDTCSTADEAQQALLSVKQYYRFTPCQYIVADRLGSSFVYANSTGRNVQYVFDGNGSPQIATNFQFQTHPTPETRQTGPLSMETNAFWRYRELSDRIERHDGAFSAEDMKQAHASANIAKMLNRARAPDDQGNAVAGVFARTLWHSLYDQQMRRAQISFYLGEDTDASGAIRERRSEYLGFGLDP